MPRALFRRVLSLPIWLHSGLAALSVAGFQWVKGRLDSSYAASRHPVDYMTGQTGFSGEAITAPRPAQPPSRRRPIQILALSSSHSRSMSSAPPVLPARWRSVL